MKSMTAIASILAAATAMAVESTNQWYLRGPDGGYVYRVGIDPVSNRPLAGGVTGIFRYNAGSFRWEFANAGAPTPVVADIATLPGATLVNSDGYIARSTDGGVTWSNVSAAAMGGKVTAVVTSAASGTRAYAAVNYGNGDPNGGLWVSNNLGASWTQSMPTAGSDMALVRVAASDANLIFVAGPPKPDTGSADDGKSFLFRSADGGATFSQVAVSSGTSWATGLPLGFVDVQQDPFNPSRFVALTTPPPDAFTAKDSGGEVLVSTDGGLTWTSNLNNFLVAAEPAGPGGEPRAVLFDRFNAGVIYFATSWGVYKTSGGPAAVASNGLMRLGARPSGGQPYDETSHMAQASDANHTLYAATVSGGVYRSIDGAANWSAITPGYNGLDVRMFAFQPGNTGVVLAGAADPSRINGVYRSIDGGVTWTRSATGMNTNAVRGLAFAPGNPNLVLAAGFPQQTIGGEINKGVWRSVDAGQTWNAVTASGIRNSGGKRNIQFDPADGNRVLLSAASALSVSTDGGVTWINSVNSSASFTGLPMQASSKATLLGLAAGPGPVSGTRFYAAFDDGNWPNPPPPGGAGGVYFSDDGAYHWTPGSGLPDDSANFISVSPTPGTVYASKAINGTTRAGGVFKSIDYGATWNAAVAGLPCLDIFAVAADPTDPNIVWTACRYSDIAQPGGIFRSNDAAASWVPYGRGLRIPSILWLSVDPADHNHLLAGGLEGIHEMHFAPDADQDGVPDSEEGSVVPGGDANNDGTPDANQANVASSAVPAGARPSPQVNSPTASDYVVVELDRSAPYTGTCQFVSDLEIVPTAQIAPSNRMLQAAPTVRFILPNCTQATVKIRYSALTAYPVGVLGSYSPVTPGDAASIAWGLFAANKASVDGSGVWSVQLDQNGYGNVYAPNTGSMLFQGAPGRDSVFGSGFEL
jgi:hypothetical protein